MVPTSYHAFFGGAASVAGALIGLLFVAISVSPHKVSGDEASTEYQVKASMAFSMLINALVLALFALLPGTDLGTYGIVLAGIGLSSTTGLTVASLRNHDTRRHRPTLVRLGVSLVVFAFQLWVSIRLADTPHRTELVREEAIVAIVLFVVAIDRAWELIGINDQGLFTLFGAMLRQHRAASSALAPPSLSEERGPDESTRP
jgi:hypothetical protein